MKHARSIRSVGSKQVASTYPEAAGTVTPRVVTAHMPYFEMLSPYEAASSHDFPSLTNSDSGQRSSLKQVAPDRSVSRPDGSAVVAQRQRGMK